MESFFERLQQKPSERECVQELVMQCTASSLPKHLERIHRQAQELNLKTRFEPQESLFPAREENHQRVCLALHFFPLTPWHDFLSNLEQNPLSQEKGLVGCVLDQVQDPRNFGAVLRSAAFFGLDFVLFAKDRQAPLSPLVFRTSAGGATQLQLVEVTNISRALKSLQEQGLWMVATACTPEATPLEKIEVDRPLVVVVGNEEKGVRREVLKGCDYQVNIPGGSGTLDSLNVSVAAAICFHSLQRPAPANGSAP